MKQRKIGKIMLCLALAVVMCFGMMTTALAAPAAATDRAAITKVLVTGQTTTIPNLTFKYKFTQNTTLMTDSTNAPITVSKNNVPIKDVSIDVTNSLTSTENAAAGTKTFTVESGNFLAKAADNANFAAAGIYVYDVVESTETADIPTGFSLDSGKTYKNAAKTEALTYSAATYRVFVYVKNATAPATGVEIANVGVVRTAVDGTEGSSGTAGDAKIDPTPGTGAMKFQNNYIKSPGENPPPASAAALTLSKTVAGDYGDRAMYFTYTMSFTKPAISTATAYKAYVMNAGRTSNETSAENYAGAISTNATYGKYFNLTLDGSAMTIKLKHDQILVITNAEVGTRYTCTETGVAGYTPTANVAVNGGTAVAVSAAKGANLVIKDGGNSGTTPIVIGENANTVAVTNTFETTTPTGIIMNNLPYIMLIVVALGALVAFVVVKSRKRKTADNRH